MSKTRAGDLTTIPAVPPAGSFDAAKKIQARLDELAQRRDRVARDLDDAAARLADREQHEARTVSQLLEADRLPDSLATLDVEALQSEAGQLSRELTLLMAAISEGETLLARARVEVMPQALRELRAWHRAVAVEAARQLCQVQLLLRLEETARDMVEQAGFDRAALGAVTPGFLGDLDPTPLASWLTGLVAEGILSGRETWLDGTGVDDTMAPGQVAAREVIHQRNALAVEEEARRRSKANGDLTISLARW